MRERFVGTWIGSRLEELRSNFELLRLSISKQEQLCAYFNDHFATRLACQLSQGSENVLDVGAHIGSFTAAVNRLGHPLGRIIAFEPVPTKANWLKRRFPDLEVHQAAAGGGVGEITFYVDQLSSALSSMVPPGSEGIDNPTISKVQVPLTTIDAVVGNRQISFVKMDVEGAELEAIRGARQVLSDSRPILMFESGPWKDDAERARRGDLWNLLTNFGYLIFVPDRVPHNAPAISCDTFLDSHIYPRRTTNYFAIARERREEVLKRASSYVHY